MGGGSFGFLVNLFYFIIVHVDVLFIKSRLTLKFSQNGVSSVDPCKIPKLFDVKLTISFIIVIISRYSIMLPH